MGKLLAILGVSVIVGIAFLAFGETSAPPAARIAVMQPLAAGDTALVLDAEGGRVTQRSQVAAICDRPCLPDHIEMGPILVNERPVSTAERPQG